MRVTGAWICLSLTTFAPVISIAQAIDQPRIVLPVPDAERGRSLFASKGCVVCHSINGIGGQAGPALDTVLMDGAVDPVEFAASMWRGAAAMVLLQSMEFGYQISLTGQDISDLAAFVSSPEQRGSYSENDIPELLRGWTIDEPLDAFGEGWDGESEVLPGESGGERIPNLTRGQLLAGRWCTACHTIGPYGKGADVGPAFAEIAKREDASEDEIRDWLAVPHAGMPEFINLSDNDIDDLAAYIMSLRPDK